MPKYFYAAFGDAFSDNPPESGALSHRHPYICNKKVSKEDVILLYCTDTFRAFQQQAMGIGIVTDVKHVDSKDTIYYQFFPLNYPVRLGTLKLLIPELENRTNFGLMGNWIFPISCESFTKVLTSSISNGFTS